MTTATTVPAMRGRGDFARVLLAEWTKFRTIRASQWTLIVATVVTVGLGATVLAGVLEEYDVMTAAERARFDPTAEGLWYHGLHLGQVILAVLGVLVATSEYSTGSIHPTLAATPNRLRVFAAKTLGFGGLAAAVGLAQAYTMFVVAQPILARRDLDVPLGDPVALRGVAWAGAATAGVALLGLGAGLVMRHTAAAVSTVLIVILGIPIIGLFLPRSWSSVTKYLPADAGWALFTPNGQTLDVGLAAAVFFGYVAALLAAAAVALVRRDV
jgi:ABC-2 type transport system permease protein